MLIMKVMVVTEVKELKELMEVELVMEVMMIIMMKNVKEVIEDIQGRGDLIPTLRARPNINYHLTEELHPQPYNGRSSALMDQQEALVLTKKLYFPSSDFLPFLSKNHSTSDQCPL